MYTRLWQEDYVRGFEFEHLGDDFDSILQKGTLKWVKCSYDQTYDAKK